MGAGHSHGAANGHAGRHYRARLTAAFGLAGVFLAVELLSGILSGSLALISDAGHMAADVVALGAAIVATKIAARPDSTGRRTYGSYRAEVFASGLTVLIMLGVAAYVVVEAVARVSAEPVVASTTMLVVGAMGLAINIASILLLRAGSRESLNVRGAYAEVVADAAGSLGVIAAGLLVIATGNGLWDTLVALAIGAFVAVRAIVLGRQVLAVLGQHVPEGMRLDEVVADLEAVPSVSDVHDLHIWTLTSGMNVATAHLVVDEGADPQAVLIASQAVLAERHHIEHATLQVEDAPTRQCHELDW